MTKPWDELKAIHLNDVGMTLEALAQNVAQSELLLAQIKAIHKAYAHKYLSEDRAVAHAHGLVHSEEEGKAIDATLSTAEENPALVSPLAALDDGDDDDTFEIPLLYARLEASKRLQAIGQEAIEIGTTLLDTAAFIGQNPKSLTSSAYRLLKPAAAVNPKIHTSLALALAFHKKRASKKPR